jgi:isocitrate/isopropylmalate dehydrogenase
LDLFANLRPAVVFDALANSSALKLDVVKGLDILILRELTSGVYFGQPRGIEKISEGEEKAVDTQSYTTSEVKRIGYQQLFPHLHLFFQYPLVDRNIHRSLVRAELKYPNL